MDATGLEWKDFFGSSVSFELTLIAELDQLIQTGGNSTENDENLVVEQRQPEEVDLLSNGSINKVAETSIESREENNNKEEVLCSQKDETSSTMPHQMWPQTDNYSADSTCKLTKMTSAATLATTVVYENLSANSFCDDRKRPISVNSTSSSSTTSSLPRRYRKKFATSGVNNNVDSDDEKTTSSLASNLETVHPVSCSLSTVAECSPSDWMSSSSTSPAAASATRFQFSTTGEKRTESSSPHRCEDAKDDSATGYCRSSSDDGDVADRRTGNNVVAVRGGVIVRRVIDEIVETERAYVRDLGDVINGYASSIRSSTVKLGLAADDVKTMFGNIEQIYQFNRSFLAKLEQCGSDPVKICAQFVENIDGFAIYSDYCANYPKAITILTKYMHDDVISGALKHQQMALKHVLPLGSYLLKPVQRILKYHLLLQKISKCTSNHHHTYENVVRPADSDVLQLQQQMATGGDVILAAVGAMMDVATRVNEMKVGHRLDVRIQELQSEICDWSGPDLTAFGPVILEEKFRISGARASRLVVLFQRAILIAKKRRSDNGLIVKAFIECSNLMLIESVPKEPLSFHVIPFDSPRIQYTIQARNLEQKRLWCQKIKMMILDNYNAVIPEKAKELVMNLGSRRAEDKEDKNRPDLPSRRLQQHPPQRFHHQHQASPPQYLEKWRVRRKSAGVVQLQGVKCSVDAKDASSSSALSPTPSPQPRRRSDVTELLYGACTMASTQTSKSCSIDTVASGSVSISDSITSLSSFDQETKCHYSISSETSPLLERCQSQPTGQVASPSIDSALPAHSDHSCIKISAQPQQQLSLTDDDDEGTNASSPDVASSEILPVTLTAQRPSIPDIRVEPPLSPTPPCSPATPLSPELMEPVVTKPVNRILREVTGKTNADWMAAVSPANCEPYRRDSIALTKAKRASATITSVVGNIADCAAIHTSVSESPTASASPPIAGNLKLLYCEFTESDVGVSGEVPSQSTGNGEPSSQKLQAMTRPGPEGSESADADVRKKALMSLPLHGRSLSDPVVREPADGIEEECRNRRSGLARKMELCEQPIANETKKFKAVAGDDIQTAGPNESKCEELGGSSEGEDQLWMPRQDSCQHQQQQQQQQQQNVEDWQARRKYLRLKNAQAGGALVPRLSPTSHSSAVAAAIKRRLPTSPSETMLKSAAECSKCSDRHDLQRTNGSDDPEFAVAFAERLDPRKTSTLPRRSHLSGKMASAEGIPINETDFGSVSPSVAPSRKVICTEKLQTECPDPQPEMHSYTTTTTAGASWTIPRSKPPSTLNLYQSDLAQEILNDLLVQSPDSVDLLLPSPDDAAGRQKSASLSPDNVSPRHLSWYSLKGRQFSTSYSTDEKSSSSSVNTPNVSPSLDDALFFAAIGSESNISTSASLPRMKAAASNLSRLSTTSTSYDDLTSPHQNRTHDGPVATATTPERIFDALKETFATFISKIGRGPEAVDNVSGSASLTSRYDTTRRKQLLEQLCQQENRRQLRCVSLDESPAFDQRSRQIGERIAKFFPSRSMDQHFSLDNQLDTCSASSAKTPLTTYPVPLPRRRKTLGEVNATGSDVKVMSVASTATEGHPLASSISEQSTA